LVEIFINKGRKRMSDCYKCKHRQSIPGNAHSKCMSKSAIKFIVENIPNVGAILPLKINKYGLENGWALWPFDFDPIWLSECQLFEEKEKE
jgi:hypothetical protein